MRKKRKIIEDTGDSQVVYSNIRYVANENMTTDTKEEER